MTDAGTSDAHSGESKRVAPRSPRAALEPEYMSEPKRPSRRARHPLVIAGNAIFTIILVIAIAGGLAYSYGKNRLEAPGPLDRDKVVNIPRGLGLREIADLLTRLEPVESAEQLFERFREQHLLETRVGARTRDIRLGDRQMLHVPNPSPYEQIAVGSLASKGCPKVPRGAAFFPNLTVSGLPLS